MAAIFSFFQNTFGWSMFVSWVATLGLFAVIIVLIFVVFIKMNNNSKE